MNPKPIEQAKTRDLALSLQAMKRARKRAEELARATNTPLVQVVDGKVVLVTPGRSADQKPIGAETANPGAALSVAREVATLFVMTRAALPSGVLEAIVEVLEPEEVWLFGSRARETQRSDSDWDVMAILPDSASEEHLDLVWVWDRLREVRRHRVEVFPIRRSEFEAERETLGALSEAVAREGHVLYGAPFA